MEVKIELDPNKIDYEEINKKIQEKVDAMNLEELKPIDATFDRLLQKKIEEYIDGAYSNILSIEYGHAYPSDKGREIISTTARDYLKTQAEAAINKVMDEQGLKSDDLYLEILKTTYPSVCTTVLYDLIDKHFMYNLNNMKDHQRNETLCQVENIVQMRIHQAHHI